MTKDDKLGEYRRKRDFSRTAEPRGGRVKRAKKLAFVIQKHAASHLHFDLRLELDGVMKSWAVPKGPSLDPTVKRLAVEVEDHPIDYNTFEGTIPRGQYGGGTVMLWDRGTYRYGGDDPDPLEGLRGGYAKGDFKFVLSGRRLRGSWVLVRTRRGDSRRPQWLLIKHRDAYAEEGADVVAEATTSVATGRTMEEIAAG
jgi:bifunctional non-homologous end joining protein LigD